MGCGKDAYEASAGMERNRYFRERIVFAANVVLVLAYVGGIAHLASRSDVADHAFFANLQTMAFVVHATAMHPGHYHFRSFLIMQINAGFHAAKGARYVIHDVVDELIKVEYGVDLLRGLLQSLQVFHLAGMQRRNGKSIGGGVGKRGHWD